MELYIDNIGIIKNSHIQFDGLTVITGKNSSGKTTVGKVMYSLINAGSNVDRAFEDALHSYICSRLFSITRMLQLRRTVVIMRFRPSENDMLDKVFRTLHMLLTHRFVNLESKALYDFLITLRMVLEELTLNQYVDFVNRSVRGDDSYYKNILDTIDDSFEYMRTQAHGLCNMTIDIIENNNAYYDFLKDRTFAYLNHEFHKQILPIKSSDNFATIRLVDRENTIINANVVNKKTINYFEDSTFIYPYSSCIFIDNPFVVDRLDNYKSNADFLSHSLDDIMSDSMISSEDISDRDTILLELLSQKEKSNYFDDVEIQKKYGIVFEKINQIVPGEFFQNTDGNFYVIDGNPLSVNNLATGSKMFYIIKKLLVNGLLGPEVMLILDEPESHLHPDWINKFAEILVVLIKHSGVNILLTTHSPNLMLALNFYAKKMETKNQCHFYLAKNNEDKYSSKIICIDDNIGEGYSHLSLPLIEMNIQMEALDGEEYDG